MKKKKNEAGGGGRKSPSEARRGGGYANTLKMFSAADCYLCVCLSFLNVVRLTESNNECLPFLFSLSLFCSDSASSL